MSAGAGVAWIDPQGCVRVGPAHKQIGKGGLSLAFGPIPALRAAVNATTRKGASGERYAPELYRCKEASMFEVAIYQRRLLQATIDVMV